MPLAPDPTRHQDLLKIVEKKSRVCSESVAEVGEVGPMGQGLTMPSWEQGRDLAGREVQAGSRAARGGFDLVSVGLASLFFTGCLGQDYGLASGKDFNPPAEEELQVRIDIALQRNEWGRQTTRCQIQVTFAPDRSSEGAGDRAGEIYIPEEPGTCAFSQSEAPRPIAEADDPDDNWQLEGGVLGPQGIQMADEGGTWELEGVETGDEGVRYEWPDCSAEAFPTSRTLGLSVPRTEEPNGIWDFTMSDLAAVGPLVEIWEPAANEEGGMAEWSVTQDLPVSWSLEGEDPVLDGTRLSPRVGIILLHQDKLQEEGDRWLACTPEEEEGTFIVPAADLATLIDGAEDEERYQTYVDVHTQIKSPERRTPWGELIRVSAHLSAGAPVDLQAPSGQEPE